MNSTLKSHDSKISQQVRIWNAKNPLDLWWRRKYKIPFGSKKHLKANFFDMAFDFLEDRYIELEEIKERLKLQNSGNNENVIPMSKEEIDEEFENLDV